LQADLECDEATFTYPTTFQAKFIFARMIAAHAQVMTEKGNSMEAQVDILARLTKNVYGGGELIYDDKAKSLILSKYGLFWKYNKDFGLGLELSKVGDTTSIGANFSLDTTTRKISAKTALHKKLDENTSAQSRIDNLGNVDLLLKSKLTSNLEATFSTGANVSAIFHGKTHGDTYSGVQFKFSL
jgi:hypothetical protein